MLRGIKVKKEIPKPKQQEEEFQTKKKVRTEDQIMLSNLHRQRIKEKGLDFEDIQDDEELGTQPKTKQQQRQELQRQNQAKGEQMFQQRKNARVLETCKYCIQNEQLGENYIISNGQNTVLLFSEKSIFINFKLFLEIYQDYFHLLIIPIDHINSLNQVDDETYEEIRNYMKCLIQCFDKQNLEVVFYENAYNFKNFPHAMLECVAYPALKDANIDLYFKTGMDELDGFWSTHKKIIQIEKSKGGIRKQIPKGFPYFYVDFSLENGYAHVIENERYFSVNFAREILATILKIDKNLVTHPPDRSSKEAAIFKEKFKAIWDEYDWTNLLDKQK